MLRLSFFMCLMLSTSISAQALSPDEIARMLNSEKPVENPYAALLNDPDPKRGIGAMRIMMESRDESLVALALEYGMLSANADVQIAALEAYMHTTPRMLVTIDGRSGLTRGMMNFAKYYDGLVSEDQKVFFNWQLGPYNDDKECILNETFDKCAFLINKYGIFLDVETKYSATMEGQLSISENGYLFGDILFGEERFPTKIELLD